VIAYLGPCSRPDIARIRGVAADSVVAGLVERGLISESGRDEGGAVRYRTTPLFERVFGLENLSALPRLDDLGGTADEIRAGSRRSPSAKNTRPTRPGDGQQLVEVGRQPIEEGRFLGCTQPLGATALSRPAL
jgi:segregation and condensation protein B